MSSAHDTETVALKMCCRCSSGLLDRDRYCRRCGAPQYTTSALDRESTRSGFYRPVSGPLLKEMVAGLSAGVAEQPGSRIVKTITLTMVCVPIWLMILLLSPLDAWRTARVLARQV